MSLNIKPHSTIVSFDIGKVNMSYCIVNLDNNDIKRPMRIHDWCLTNLTSNDEKETIEIICSKV